MVNGPRVIAEILIMDSPLGDGRFQAQRGTAPLGGEFFAFAGNFCLTQLEAGAGVVSRWNVRRGRGLANVLTRAEALESVTLVEEARDGLVVDLRARGLDQNLAIPIDSQCG